MVRRSRPGGGIRVIRGEVWLAALDPTVGAEVQKTRPCVILSPPEMNERLRTIIAAPMTTGSRPAPSRIPIVFEARSGLILLDQMRALDKRRLIRRLGTLSAQALNLALSTLREVRGVNLAPGSLGSHLSAELFSWLTWLPASGRQPGPHAENMPRSSSGQ